MSGAFDLDALIDTWRGPLVGLLAARGASRDEAIELAQDAFAEAWLGRERFRGDPGDERAVGRWLSGIAVNLLRATNRRRGRLRPHLEDAGVDGTEAPHVEETDDPGAERLRRLREAIVGLPERERAVVQAFYLEETSVARVAALLSLSERAVEGLLFRARERLRERLSFEISADVGQLTDRVKPTTRRES